jgi:glycine dehydrogenase
MASLYASWHGPSGLRRIAERVHRLTSIAAAALRAAGHSLVHTTWFDTLCVAADADDVLEAARAAGLDMRRVAAGQVTFSFDETTTIDVVNRVLAVFGADAAGSDVAAEHDGIRAGRTSEFLTQGAFNRYHTEHEMLRYLRRLADKDLALDRTMIPLGSCTMKLNAAAEMIPVTWPEFADVHPFAPDDETAGYREMIDQLKAMLVAVTGYDEVSLQPNAGSQGEFAGLLAIRAYHRSRGDDARTVCLIPSSAHGTNAASAVMAGLQVVVVACDDLGNIDLADLSARATAAGATLAAAMITYPSTHGVFEERITEICEIVHEFGGQVYVDGANLNALVGLARPGKFGADVSHLNLHKTFCIPHGGGGPGMGPIGVAAHLIDFLPTHPMAKVGGKKGVGPVSAAPFGSSSILLISWVYIRLMGPDGLTDATKVAILSANYIAKKLQASYPVLYEGTRGRVAHECIVDMRKLKGTSGIEVEDIAKRLMDYGFHAPTVSFPVAGTMMIEPTESESKAEIDRFCDALNSIREEIRDIEEGKSPKENNVLKNAPHTAAVVTQDEWNRPYPRSKAAYPMESVRQRKFWPSVGRVNGALGDRKLVCSCPPIEDYAS